jgi:hypothetical protein
VKENEYGGYIWYSWNQMLPPCRHYIKNRTMKPIEIDLRREEGGEGESN